MEDGTSAEERQCRESSGRIGPSQVGLVAEEEHGLRQEGEELQRASKGFNSEGDDDPQPHEVHRRGRGSHRRGQAQNERPARNY